MTTINAHKLQRLIKQTRPHISTDETLPPLNGIHFQCDGIHIHALASDRYTFAAARTKVREETDTWAVTIAAKDLNWVTAWLETHEGDTILNLSIDADGLVITDDHGKLIVPAKDLHFPQWQHFFKSALQDASTSGDLVNVDTKMLARWKHADSHLRVWQTAPEKPLLLVGDDFIGLQMPARYGGDKTDRAAVLSDWSEASAKKRPSRPPRRFRSRAPSPTWRRTCSVGPSSRRPRCSAPTQTPRRAAQPSSPGCTPAATPGPPTGSCKP
jgi:hypothetical protein